MNEAIAATVDAPTTSPPPAEPPPSALDSAFSELAHLDEPVKTTPEPKPDTKPVTEPEKKVAATPPDETKPVRAAELRAAYDKQKQTLKERETELARMKSELEKRSQPVEDQEKKTLAEKLTAAEQRALQLEEKTRLLDFRSSEEFQTKYWKPYQSSITQATDDLDGVTYTDKEGATRAIDGNLILWLSNMKPVQAEAQAVELFGAHARLVTDRIDRIRNAAREMNGAVAEHQKTAQEHYKQTQQQQVEFGRQMAKVWEGERKAWPDKFPNFFAPKEGDDEGNTLLTKGYELAESAFFPNGKSPQEMAKIHAEVYNKAAAFPRVALNLKRAKTRIKELEATLAEYENAELPGGTGTGTQTKPAGDPYSEAMTELAGLK